jgi:hypothetical protein
VSLSVGVGVGNHGPSQSPTPPRRSGGPRFVNRRASGTSQSSRWRRRAASLRLPPCRGRVLPGRHGHWGPARRIRGARHRLLSEPPVGRRGLGEPGALVAAAAARPRRDVGADCAGLTGCALARHPVHPWHHLRSPTPKSFDSAALRLDNEEARSVAPPGNRIFASLPSKPTIEESELSRIIRPTISATLGREAPNSIDDKKDVTPGKWIRTDAVDSPASDL